MHTPVYVDSIGGETVGGISKNPACGHTLPFLDWLFPSSSSSSLLWKSKVNRNYITASVGMSGTTTDRKLQTGELSKLPVCSQGIFFFFFSLRQVYQDPEESAGGGWKKKKKNPQ